MIVDHEISVVDRWGRKGRCADVVEKREDDDEKEAGRPSREHHRLCVVGRIVFGRRFVARRSVGGKLVSFSFFSLWTTTLFLESASNKESWRSELEWRFHGYIHCFIQQRRCENRLHCLPTSQQVDSYCKTNLARTCQTKPNSVRPPDRSSRQSLVRFRLLKIYFGLSRTHHRFPQHGYHL